MCCSNVEAQTSRQPGRVHRLVQRRNALWKYGSYQTHRLKAAIGSNAAMVVSANIETDGKETLTRGMRKFGDKFGRIELWVMHSSAYFDIVDEAIANKVCEEVGVVINGGLHGTLGKPALATDRAPVDAILGLRPNAVFINESQARVYVLTT